MGALCKLNVFSIIEKLELIVRLNIILHVSCYNKQLFPVSCVENIYRI